MDDNEFRERSDAALSKVAKWLEDFDPDEVDYTTADGVVTMGFSAGAKFILSRQSQMKQMWLAATGSHGYHYGWDAARSLWLDNKRPEFFPRLAEAISEELGHPIDPL